MFGRKYSEAIDFIKMFHWIRISHQCKSDKILLSDKFGRKHGNPTKYRIIGIEQYPFAVSNVATEKKQWIPFYVKIPHQQGSNPRKKTVPYQQRYPLKKREHLTNQQHYPHQIIR